MTLKAVLALLQAAILAAGLALLGSLVVESLERTLRSETDDLLAARADATETAIRARLTRAGEGAGLADLSRDPASRELFTEPGLIYEVWDTGGRLVAGGRGLPESGLPWTEEARAAAARGEPYLESESVGERDRVRVLTRPVVEGGRVLAIVRVGESLRLIDAAVTDLVRLLMAGGALVLAVCIVATWVVVSRALEPLETISTAAERIAVTGDVAAGVRVEGTLEVQRLAISFNRMVGRLRRLLATQRQLLADTSHELRNPLTVIRTDLDLLGRDLDPETRQEVAAEAQEEAERMTRLVADLLFLAREEGAARGPVQPVRLDTLAAEVVDRLQQIAPEHTVTVGHAEPATVSGNPDRLRQLVTNLVENGIRYTPPGGHVTVDILAHPGGPVRLDVSDDGVGIAAEHLPRVFDRFYRVDPARGRSTGGTGLGLAIVKHVAETHGGSVRAESAPGAGSRFTVLLPADVQPRETPRSGSMEPPGPASPETPPAPAASAAAPSARAADSPPAETPQTPDHPAQRP